MSDKHFYCVAEHYVDNFNDWPDCDIVLAENEDEALSKANIRGEIEYYDATIIDGSDQFVKDGIIPKWFLFESGWIFECDNCGRKIAHGECYDNNEEMTVDTIIFSDETGFVYCDRYCEK